MAQLAKVVKILGGLAALYPRYELTEATIAAYHRVLEDVPGDVLDRAALHLGSTNTFFPAAAELRAAAFELVETAQGIPNAWDAWTEVTKSFGTNGIYWGAPDWTHPLIARAVDAIGGYAALCRSENAMADRARFVQAYETFLLRERDKSRMLPKVREAIERIVSGDGRDLLREENV